MGKKLAILLSIFSIVLVADQATKYWAVARLTRIFELTKAETASQKVRVWLTEKNLEGKRTRPVVVLRQYWQHKYVENPGAAWGLLGRAPKSVRVPFFHVMSVVAITFILLFYRRLEPEQRVLQVALALVLGGAVGNFVDRLLRGYVIDFVDWHWKNEPGTHWPTFNVADIGISLGVALMLADTLLQRREEAAPSVAARTGVAAPMLPGNDGAVGTGSGGAG